MRKVGIGDLIKALFTNKPLLVVFAGFVLTLFTFAVNILLSFDVTKKLYQGKSKIEKTYATISRLDEILVNLYQNESLLRSYYITRNEEDFKLFSRHSTELTTRTNEFIKSQDVNVISVEVLVELRNLIAERKEIFNRTAEELNKPTPNLPIIRKLITQGNDKSADVRMLVNDIILDLRKSIKENQEYVNKNVQYTSYINYIAIFIAFVVAVFANISITQDYLRQKEIERILRQLNDEKTKLFSILGHDLRTPFTGINGTIYLLLRHYDDMSDEEILKYLKEMENTAKGYQSLLDDVLTWSRLQMNKIRIEPEEVKVQELVDSIIKIYKDQAAAKALDIKNQIPINFSITADVNMLHTLIRNIYSNAIKFSRQGGQIRFNASLDNEWAQIEISDDGVGISEAVKQKLFTNNSISMPGTANEQGTGLGLAICKEFLDKVNGRLEIHSEVGQGATFTIKLPNNKS